MIDNHGSIPIKVFLVAGEPSGDVLASRLMIGLRNQANGCEISFTGVGGPLMEAEGLISLFPMDELSIMGIAEVVPKIPSLLKRINQTAQAATETNPDLFITVDAPDFSFRVAKKLDNVTFKKVHYVAPSVWAWRKGRAKKIARLYDHLLTLLPFEPPYFEVEGLPASFIGHSIIESGAGQGNAVQFKEKYLIGDADNNLMILPGSRRGEVTRHLEVFGEAVKRVSEKVDNLNVVIPVIGKTKPLVEDAVKHWAAKIIIVEGTEDKYDAMAASDVAMAASGTVGLELGLSHLPSVIAYKMHPITAYLARKLVKLKYANLINILEDEEIVPEHLLENCTADNLSKSIIELFVDSNERSKQIAGYDRAIALLGVGAEAPGDRAAKVVLDLVGRL
ncbi:lipid-A-disaccharide synthase [Alphaproteobacteria bacterium 46_93_T64]|nr:lipid-A-disaccharide synthase [Alphaproteobacteria bacterium 46_93_T64]